MITFNKFKGGPINKLRDEDGDLILIYKRELQDK